MSLLLVVGVAVFFGSNDTKFSFLSNYYNNLISQCGFIIGLILIGVFILMLSLETILLLKLPISPLIGKLISLLSIFANFLRNLYVFTIKILISGAVEEIITNKKSGQEITYIFERQQNDDHFYPDVINLGKNEIEISARPSESTSYWRLGIKLSKSETFCSARHGAEYPLLHLTKELRENVLRATYYDDSSKQIYNKPILENYKHEEINISVYMKRNKVTVIIRTAKGKNLLTETINDYKFAQIFAWGDGNQFV